MSGTRENKPREEWRQEARKLLKRLIDLRGTSNTSLARALSAHENTIGNWITGKSRSGPSREELQKICLYLGADGNWFFDAQRFLQFKQIKKIVADFPHPHLKLLRRLKNEVLAGMSSEIVGFPGLFKTQVLHDLERSLTAEKSNSSGKTIRCFFHKLATKNSVEEFWDSLGGEMMGKKGRYDHGQIQEFMRNTKSVLLIDDADQFLNNICKLTEPREFNVIADQWLANLQNLGGAVVMASTIYTGDLVPLAGGYSPSRFTPIAYKDWNDEEEWNLWTGGLLVRKGISEHRHTKKLQNLKDKCAKVPRVYQEAIKLLLIDYDFEAVHKQIENKTHVLGEYIWARLPRPGRVELKKAVDCPNSSLCFAEGSRLRRALLAAGICYGDGPILEAHVKAWKAIWAKAELS